VEREQRDRAERVIEMSLKGTPK